MERDPLPGFEEAHCLFLSDVPAGLGLNGLCRPVRVLQRDQALVLVEPYQYRVASTGLLYRDRLALRLVHELPETVLNFRCSCVRHVYVSLSRSSIFDLLCLSPGVFSIKGKQPIIPDLAETVNTVDKPSFPPIDFLPATLIIELHMDNTITSDGDHSDYGQALADLKQRERDAMLSDLGLLDCFRIANQENLDRIVMGMES
jgi:hypothetical protein